MKITAKQYACSLYESLEEKSEGELDAVVERFVRILIRNRHIGKIQEIIGYFEKYWEEKNGEMTARLTSARGLNLTAREAIVAYLKRKTEAKNIRLEEVIDEKILGGFILRYDNKVVDGSLKNNLEELKKKMSA